jgi:hypothetical protein
VSVAARLITNDARRRSVPTQLTWEAYPDRNE